MPLPLRLLVFAAAFALRHQVVDVSGGELELINKFLPSETQLNKLSQGLPGMSTCVINHPVDDTIDEFYSSLSLH